MGKESDVASDLAGARHRIRLPRGVRAHQLSSSYPTEVIDRRLSVTTGEVLVDLACGAGGPGLWAAKETGARLVGIDLSPMAAKLATERAGALGMSERATFSQGTFEATGLESASADAAMSVDALQYVPDKSKALVEVARVLRPGGHFAFVAFELDPERVQGWRLWDDAVPDYRPRLESAGFEVVRYDQIPNWAEHVTAGFGAVLQQRNDAGS